MEVLHIHPWQLDDYTPVQLLEAIRYADGGDEG